ncbi:hypothetical protein A8C32_03535 [Flavivirga aquatica]|uniref:BioF2-like acetyltransferase domain-containing protein n=1 Tax=Flavivirga aquatica TaxID=1849968 RepID=A0A1E5TB17_9FLAO|nr:GNAT family N-acetyltransferase [Flavivirga aquatica]OEK08538.1 hypothetical protein A8C32_03535 [Flavivirga aquatica]
MSIKNKIPIFPILFRNADIQQLYKSIEYFNLKVYNNNHNSKTNSTYSHKLVPEYFKLKLRDTSFKRKIIPQFNWGYSILLNHSDSIEDYIQRQFNSKKRNILLRYKKRLETCFNIKYKMFYGEISKAQYRFIMESLRNMIVRRFKERNEAHKNLYEWDYLLENTYLEIINQNASFFVIYNEDKPIEISLNYHFDKVLFSFISSYDIDYSKFGLGHVEIYKQVEWCANNNYILFEMGVGGMDYKRRWSNNIYRYNHYIVYKTMSTKLKLTLIKIQLKEYLKAKKINEIPPRINRYLTKKTLKQNLVICSKINTIEEININNYKEVNHTSKNYNILKRHINDFLYLTSSHYNTITLYKKDNSFIIKGINNYQKLSLPQ